MNLESTVRLLITLDLLLLVGTPSLDILPSTLVNVVIIL